MPNENLKDKARDKLSESAMQAFFKQPKRGYTPSEAAKVAQELADALLGFCRKMVAQAKDNKALNFESLYQPNSEVLKTFKTLARVHLAEFTQSLILSVKTSMPAFTDERAAQKLIDTLFLVSYIPRQDERPVHLWSSPPGREQAEANRQAIVFQKNYPIGVIINKAYTELFDYLLSDITDPSERARVEAVLSFALFGSTSEKLAENAPLRSIYHFYPIRDIRESNIYEIWEKPKIIERLIEHFIDSLRLVFESQSLEPEQLPGLIQHIKQQLSQSAKAINFSRENTSLISNAIIQHVKTLIEGAASCDAVFVPKLLLDSTRSFLQEEKQHLLTQHIQYFSLQEEDSEHYKWKKIRHDTYKQIGLACLKQGDAIPQFIEDRVTDLQNSMKDIAINAKPWQRVLGERDDEDYSLYNNGQKRYKLATARYQFFGDSPLTPNRKVAISNESEDSSSLTADEQIKPT